MEDGGGGRNVSGGGAPVRVAYLVSEYPAYSHTFIESEIRALRDVGAHVDVFSVRPGNMATHPEYGDVFQVLRATRRSLWIRLLVDLLRRPRATLGGLAAAFAFGRGRTARDRVWQIFYWGEALVLLHELRARCLTHVHVHFPNSAADIARLAAHMGSRGERGVAGVTWSLTVHGSTEFENAGRFDLEGKVASAAFTVCITDFARSQVMRHTRPDLWPSLHVLRVGLSEATLDRLVQCSVPHRDDDSLGRELRVLFVGRLSPEKGVPVLIEALERWAASPDFPRALPVKICLVGDGPSRDEVHRRLESLAGEFEVTTPGALPHDQVLDWFLWADVFCLPSFNEGLPVVLMEALAAGLVVVTTRIAGVPELVVDSATGFLVPPGRSDAISAALQDIARQWPAIAKLGVAGREAVLEKHRASTNVVRLLELLSPYVSDASGPGGGS